MDLIEDGYYWVKLRGNWYIFTYSGAGTWHDGSDNLYFNEDFEEINENRIKAPDEE